MDKLLEHIKNRDYQNVAFLLERGINPSDDALKASLDDVKMIELLMSYLPEDKRKIAKVKYYLIRD